MTQTSHTAQTFCYKVPTALGKKMSDRIKKTVKLEDGNRRITMNETLEDMIKNLQHLSGLVATGRGEIAGLKETLEKKVVTLKSLETDIINLKRRIQVEIEKH